MTLSPGSRLGPYEILSPLGAGGMGEVYRARDTRLDRIVAIKILPSGLSDRSDARARFDREAKAISSLSHPNICQLYDVGSQDDVRFLVMECLEGETLADRLLKGPLPPDQVLRYGRDLCEGLDAAHRAGVVHRDLKPGNIMLTKLGAKLMDFGLAKPVLPEAPGASILKTVSQPLTEQGFLVGTYQYMSPEQLEGKEASRESDIFSLGAVLYEMVTGKRAFQGKSQLSVASAILEKEPESIQAAKPATPAALDHAIRTCLAKDPEKRWQTARDLSHALAWIAEGGPQSTGALAPPMRTSKTPVRLLAGALVAVVLLAAYLAVSLATRGSVEAKVTRASIKPLADSPLSLTVGSGLALSPDGRNLVFAASASDGKSLLWVRPLDSLQARPLAGTEGATYPFWSPDSRFLGFFAGAKLRKIEIAGGPPIILSDAFEGRGGAWNRQGDILFAPSVNGSLYRISSGGGPATPVTALDSSNNELSHRWPCFLPDGRHFLYLAGSVFTSRENPTNTLLLGSLDSKESQVVLHSHAGASYASGRILFLRLNTLMAQPFDTTSFKLTGEPVPIADPVQEASLFSMGLFSTSENGMLTYLEGTEGARRELVWFDRSGKRLGAIPGEDAYASPRLSPDGKRIVFGVDASGYHLWTYDSEKGVKTALTFGTTTVQGNIFPVWSPDGRRVAYSSTREGKQGVYVKAADGSSSEEVVIEGGNQYKFPTDWSPDGKFIAYQEGYQGGWAIWILPMEGDRKPYRFLNTQFSDREASFSPDGKWLAYCSNESGQYRVYVVPFPGPGGKWQASPGVGVSPRWRRDGKELYYLTSEAKLMAAAVSTSGSTFEVGAVQPLFDVHAYGVFARYDVSADGQRFILPFEPGQPTTTVTLVENWPAVLKQ